MELALDILAGFLLVGGSLLAFIAGLGIVRFPDLLSRMHAATKPQVLGLMLLMAGLAVELRNLTVGITLVLVVAFQLVTGPISAHMLSRAGYRTGKVDPATLMVDELTEDLERAEKLDELDQVELERQQARTLEQEQRDTSGERTADER